MYLHLFYNSESQFSNLIYSHPGLSILDMNISNAFTRFDKLKLSNQRVNIHIPVSVICLTECWINVVSEPNPLQPLRNPQYGLGETVFGGRRHLEYMDIWGFNEPN